MQHPHGLNMDTQPPKPKRQPSTFTSNLALIVATLALATSVTLALATCATVLLY